MTNIIIQKILTEWSYLLPTGIPNLNNPYHVVKLKEALNNLDFSKEDGVSTLTDIKNILERNGHMVKSQAGSNYGEMNDISDRL